jgi:3-oxoacyl-[acyl-carrier-protein] synthase-3
MHTNAREIHRVGIEEAVPMLREVLDQAELEFDQIDYLIPHQTSARAIEKGAAEFAARLGATPRHVVVTVDELGNTASTTHFIALWKYLDEGRLREDDRILLLSLASGLEVGVVIFRVGDLAARHGHGR